MTLKFEVEVDKTEAVETVYPCILQHNFGNVAVLFLKERLGVVVGRLDEGTHFAYDIGNVRDDWNEDGFVPFHGTLTMRST